MKLIYVAGPFRGPNAWAIEQNIRRAEELSLEIWRLGAAALCPHTNTRFFQGAADDKVWLEGDLEMLRRCDAVVLAPNWQHSSGAVAEVKAALLQKSFTPVFHHNSHQLLVLKDYIEAGIDAVPKDALVDWDYLRGLPLKK